MGDQNAARMALGRYLGMFTDKTQLTGPGGGPVPILVATPADLSDDQLAAIAAAGIGS
jgi:phage terminase small subunit